MKPYTSVGSSGERHPEHGLESAPTIGSVRISAKVWVATHHFAKCDSAF
jgi:hypothetical protein